MSSLRLRPHAFLLLLLCAATPQARPAAAQTVRAEEPPVTLRLDGSPVPDSETARAARGHDTSTASSELVGGGPVVRLGGVTEAYAQYFRAAEPNAPVVLVLPGGGYQILATDLEGTEVARWLNRQGLNALVLYYRVPTAPPHAEPLADAQAALDLIAKQAAAWHLDASHVAVIGFSAGADLAARLTASRPTAAGPGAIAAQLLIYPAYLADGADGLAVRSDVAPTRQTPPTFLVQTEDDPIGVRNSLAYYAATQHAGVAAELHVYAKGGHGYGLRPTAQPVTGWPEIAGRWLESHGFAPALRQPSAAPVPPPTR